MNDIVREAFREIADKAALGSGAEDLEQTKQCAADVQDAVQNLWRLLSGLTDKPSKCICRGFYKPLSCPVHGSAYYQPPTHPFGG